MFDPYIKAANALPRVVLAPIFALWFGLGIWSKVALGFTLVFFIVFFNVYQGVREVSPVVLANARMLGMNERQLLRHVYWPAALTWMFSSLHTSVGATAVRRFLRPVAWQNAPAELLPAELTDGYTGIPRRVDGVLRLPG